MRKNFTKELVLASLLIILCVVVGVIKPTFWNPVNLQNNANRTGMFGVIGLGAAAVIVTGGIDLSVGSVIALLGILLSIFLVDKQLPALIVIPGIVAIGAFLGWLHSLLIVKLRLQPFVVTLCGLLLYRGAARFIASDETKGFGDAKGFEEFKTFIGGNIVGIPASFVIFLVLMLILGVVLHRSVYGRHLFAVGKNEEAARFSGIETGKVIGYSYIIAGVTGGVAAVMFSFYTNSVSPGSQGQSYELYGIAAAVLGGFSLRGGEGSIIGVLIGSALLQVLQNFVNLLGIPSSLNFAVMGGVILLGTVADSLISKPGRRT